LSRSHWPRAKRQVRDEWEGSVGIIAPADAAFLGSGS
jgi:hypothetical protein